MVHGGGPAQGARYDWRIDATLRIIDANLNRAREGWRVMEDAARFHLDSAELCAPFKSLRHDLAVAVREAGLDEALLQAGRDTPRDVGTEIKTRAEGARANLREAVIAAGKRAGEALRSVEEALKARAGRGEAFERLRYRHYDAERALVLAMGARREAPQWRLCVIISAAACKRPWEEVARLAKAGGADVLQLREKGVVDADLLDRARRLVEIARTADPPSVFADRDEGPGPVAHAVINDRADIALLAQADGVHLGQGDLAVHEARQIVGDRLWVGVSTHDLEEARAARDAGADYTGVGAMFPTTTKALGVSGPAYLRAYLGEASLARIPHLAIGGVTPGNVQDLIAAGARGVAVSSAVCGAPEPGEVCRRLRQALHEAGA